MIILKCPKKNCEGHLVGWNYKGTPSLLPNKTHNPEPLTITPEIRKQLETERFSEPFSTFMDIIEEKRRDE